jgi:hypothetical protein
MTWVDLPVGPQFNAILGQEESNLAFETDGGIQWYDRLFQRDSWDLTFKCQFAQLADFRALHDAVDGQLTPFFITLDRTAEPLLAIYGNKEAGFMPQGTGEFVMPPVFSYNLKILGVLMSILTYIPSYTMATLPVAPAAGSLARVTDGMGGLWMYSGSAWIKQFPFINVTEAPFNARGDGSTDDSAAIMAAYDALPSTGGTLYFPYGVVGNYIIDSGLVFDTNQKPVMLVGQPAGAVQLSFTDPSGDLLTFNYGNDLNMGHGLRDLVIAGPGNSTASRGIVFGGSLGAQGFLADNIKIRTFGTGAEMGSHTFLTTFRHCMIRDCTTLLLLPSGLTEAGEQIDFDHCTFADSVSPHTNAVWIKGISQDVTFRSCSFDQAQLSIGNSTTTGAQVDCIGCHFENPNDGTNYDFITTSNNEGNYLNIIGGSALQHKATSGPAQLMTLSGGKVHINGFRIFTPAGSPLTHLAVLANAVGLEVYGFNDMSGNISGTLFGGSTTGYIVNFAGANTNNPVPQNFVMSVGDPNGGSQFDFQGSSGSELRAGGLRTVGRVFPGQDGGGLQGSIGFIAGPGAPNNIHGSDGDMYFRSDGGSMTTVYQKRSGSWIGIL